jgi:mycothiol synthase
MITEEQRGSPAHPTSRLYAGIDDLPLFVAFASRSTKERRPLRARWHPGDVVWQLNGIADRPQRNRLWFGADGVEVAAWIVDEGELWVEATAAGEGRISEAAEAAEARWRSRPSDRRSQTLSVVASEHDLARIEQLEALGYKKGRPSGVGFSMDLEAPPPAAEGPDGFSVRDSVGVDPALRAAAHRAAWDHLDHLGIDARSAFSTARYLSLRSMPVYDPALDMLVVAPDGGFVANCIAWADPASGVGVFEPVGTALAFRGRRLVRFMMSEAVRRLRAKGMREARVGTAHFNTAAISAYLAAGFSLVDRSHMWTKTMT